MLTIFYNFKGMIDPEIAHCTLQLCGNFVGPKFMGVWPFLGTNNVMKDCAKQPDLVGLSENGPNIISRPDVAKIYIFLLLSRRYP